MFNLRNAAKVKLQAVKRALQTTAALAAVLLVACQHHVPTDADNLEQTRNAIAPQLQQLGARNWVVIADPTYPIPSGAGAVTVSVPSNTADTFREVLDQLELQASVTPRIWVSNELEAVPEERAPGIGEYRKSVNNLLSGRFCYRLDERIIAMQLAEAAKQFRVLYIKTNTRLPYSTIAIELDSGYWNSDDETEIRTRLQKLNPAQPITPQPAAVTTAGATAAAVL